MNLEDLSLVDRWLHFPHVARWWTRETTAEQVIAKYRDRITTPTSRTTMLTATWTGDPIGWCQWYLWADFPDEAAAIDARYGDVGIDYAIGDPSRIGQGAGTLLITALVGEARQHHASAGVVTAPDARNVPSRRVLEKNGFDLVAVRAISTEPTDAPMTIYRLAAP